MNVLDLLKDGALAAAELSALLLVAPASAADSPAAASPKYERPVLLHRLAVAGDTEVLGALARARIPQQGAGDEPLPRAPTGHVQPTEDESVADASLIDALAASSPPRSRVVRLTLASRASRPDPRALLVDRGSERFLAIVPHRRTASGTLVLRPVPGRSETLELGALDPGVAILVPIATRAWFDALADGAIELEFEVDDTAVWTTLVAQRIDADPSHADVGN